MGAEHFVAELINNAIKKNPFYYKIFYIAQHNYKITPKSSNLEWEKISGSDKSQILKHWHEVFHVKYGDIFSNSNFIDNKELMADIL